jgi:gliding motility-associated-like protein/uncharacterized repeat protein (TIGR01451 family)
MEIFADGSKNLYPNGVRGGRAFMESVTYQNGQLTHNYYNHARHFAYLLKDETLAVASSAQGVRGGTIRIISPSGRQYSTGNDMFGKILGSTGLTNRQAELAGPRVGYQPYEIIAQEDGIWMIEFLTPDSTATNNAIPNVEANDNWTQPDNQNVIAAWDISVRNKSDTEWLSGRVFVNVLNLHIHGDNMANINRAYFGVNYVLTKDGYFYKVDGNGSIGLKFTYFVNNSGILNSDNTPSYKSSTGGYNARLHNPNSKDIGNEFVTHKIFYTVPNSDLPQNSYSTLGSTWLLNEVQIPKVSNVNIGSSESTENNINTKGGEISFQTNYAGRYKVIIRSLDDNYHFQPWESIVQGQVGANKFVWPGLDNNGNLLPAGTYVIQVSISSIEGEVHFPYFDMETNPNGLKLERLNRDDGSREPAIIYWDDSDIPRGNNLAEHSNPIVNLEGILSNINGHHWGTYTVSTGNANNNLFTGAYSFGNNMAMNTWSYAVQVEELSEKEIVVEVADLEVISLLADKDTIELNERVNYKVKVRNNGPSDVINGRFEYNLPLGFHIENISFENNDCVNISSTNNINNTATLNLDIKNGCETTFIISSFANNVPDETYGHIYAEAGLVRPKGYTDPDATLNNIAELDPKSAREECASNGCNNIKTNAEVFLLEPINERGKIALLKEVRHLDDNGSGFQEVGEILEYKFTIRNIGQVNIDELVILDSLLDPSRVSLSEVVLANDEEYSITIPYIITEEDVSKKYVINRAFVEGKNPRNFDVKDISGTTYTNDDSTKVDIDRLPLVQLKKSVVNRGTGENSQFTIDDTIMYRFEILHQGDIGVQHVQLIDNLLFTSSQSVSSHQIINQTISVDFPYYITNADIIRGFIENSAVVEAKDIKYANLLIDTSGNTFMDNQKTITTLAKPPIAFPDNMEVYQSQNILLDISANDQKRSSGWDNGRIEVIEPPSMGSLTIDGVDVYFTQHNNLESGKDYFTYRIHDNSRLTSEIVRVDIEIIRTIPVTVDDYFIQYYNSKIKINPSLNDYVKHSELDLESISVINQPLNGTLVYLGKGEFSYESNKTFSGVDEFTYRIMDKNGNWSEPATVKIEISGILIPNVITPNGDGLNDVFEIIGTYQFESVELQVFDRFKNLIYQNSNYNNNWEVSSSVRDGTYFYVVKLNKKGERPIIRRGSLLITREMLN